MGVPGLWDVLRPAGQVSSLTHLAVVDGFEKNKNGHRGFRLGIDASIWFYHATYGREGENPELRTLFFRCTRLMGMPFLPLFVFDGEERPSEKRGKRISGKDHWMVQGMQSMIDAFGFEWHMAPGEAEAELAYLNRIGMIDGILSDDVDNFLFGAQMVVRNPSANLSGNRAHALKNSAGKIDDQHVAIYKAEDLRNKPEINLTQGGLILIGILRGGDYHQAGLAGCGVTIAHGLAKCGFGDTLCQAARTMDRTRFETFLVGWREQVRAELRTNSKGFIGRKNPSLAKSMPDNFPDIDIVLSYTDPITSGRKGGLSDSRFDWEKEPDIGKVAGICELYFEWGVKEVIVKRFRTVIWPSAVLRILRRSALLADRRDLAQSLPKRGAVPSTPTKKKHLQPIGTPSKMIAKHFSSLQLSSPAKDHGESDDEGGYDNLVTKIHSTRTHASTDNILEYRLEIAPAQLVRLAEGGVHGIRKKILKNPRITAEEEEEMEMAMRGGDREDEKAPADPFAPLRVWMPACMVEVAEPTLVQEFKARELTKLQKKRAPRGNARTKASGQKVASPSQVESTHSKRTRKPAAAQSDDSDEDTLPVLKLNPSKTTTAVTKLAGTTDENALPAPASRPRPVQAGKIKKNVELSTDSRNNIEDFLKSGKPTATAKASSKTSRVASLFEDAAFSNLDDVSAVREVSKPSRPEPAPKHATSSPSETGRFKSEHSKSVLSLFTDDPQPIAPAARAKSSKEKPDVFVPRPFPVSFDEVEDKELPSIPSEGANVTSKHRRRPSVSSESDTHTEKIRKSPRKSHSRDSPRRTKTFQPESKQRDRSVSPSPMRRPPQLSSQTRPTINPLSFRTNTVIEISSDSEDNSSDLQPRTIPLLLTAKHLGPVLGTGKLKARANLSVRSNQQEVIDLT